MELNNGIHLILDIIVNDIYNPNLNHESTIMHYLDECIRLSEMEEVGSVIHKFEPINNLTGITSVRVLGTSHLSCHSWPEENYISIDLFSCKYFDVDKIINFTKEYFDTKRCDISIVDRNIGIPHKYANYIEEN